MSDDPTRQVEPVQPAEPASQPSTAPVTASAGAAGSGRLRWAVALGVAGLAIALGIAALALLGARPTPEALKYVPREAAVVAEVRMDLPGDQLQKLGNLLAHFPGFKDQSTLPDKIDEAISQALKSAGKGGPELDYRTDIKPWLSGPAFIAIPVPAAGGDASAAADRGLLSATTTGTVTCDTPLKGQTVTHESYRGLDLSVGNGTLACVLDGRQALLGDVVSVRAALDAKAGGTGMDRSERYATARDSLTGDLLATLFVDGSKVVESMPTPSGGATPGLTELTSLGGVPEWTMAGVRAEDDALVVDAVAGPRIASTTPTGAPGAPTEAPLSLPPTHPSVLAPLVPDDVILFVEHQGTGVALQNGLRRLAGLPELAPVLGIIDAQLGGANGLVDWIQDAGIVATGDGAAPGVGVLLVAKDAATATQQVRSINSVISLLGLAAEGVEIRQSEIAGVSVTTVTIADVSKVVPPMPISPSSGIPDVGPVSFSFASRDRVVIVSSGEDVMTKLLNVQQGHRLTDSAAWTRAQKRALANSRTSVYVGVPAGLALAQRFMPADELQKFNADDLPYVEPFEAVLLTGSEDDRQSRLRLVVSVSQP